MEVVVPKAAAVMAVVVRRVAEVGEATEAVGEAARRTHDRGDVDEGHPLFDFHLCFPPSAAGVQQRDSVRG